MNVAAGFLDQDRVGGHAVDQAELRRVRNVSDLGGIHKEFHGGASVCRASALVVRRILAQGIARWNTQSAESMRRSMCGSTRVFAPGEPLAVVTADGLDRVLDYRAPEGGVPRGRPRRGAARTPPGPRLVWGRAQGGFEAAKLRDVARVLDVPPLGPRIARLPRAGGRLHADAAPAMLRLATRAPGLARSARGPSHPALDRPGARPNDGGARPRARGLRGVRQSRLRAERTGADRPGSPAW